MQPNRELRRLGTVFFVALVAGAGVRYVLEKASEQARQQANKPQRLIDWQQAKLIALRFSQNDQAPLHDRAERLAQYTELVARSEPLLSDYMQVQLPAPISKIEVIDRAEWLSANLVSFQQLFTPIEELYLNNAKARNLIYTVMSALNSQISGLQVGFLLGYLARRVLGQYDLSLFSPDPQQRGVLYFVEPNINLLQRQLGLSDEDFRFWITIHECTHVFQFEAFPWVRPYFQGLVTEFLTQVSSQMGGLGSNLAQALERILRGEQDGRHWIEQLLNPEQRQIFERMQALMSVVEGYSNHTMDAIGERLMPSFRQIEERIQERQVNRPLIDVMFQRVTGMDIKLAQYQQGEAFINAVVASRGIEFANLVWRGPEYLPTLAEIKAPEQWVARVSEQA